MGRLFEGKNGFRKFFENYHRYFSLFLLPKRRVLNACSRIFWKESKTNIRNLLYEKNDGCVALVKDNDIFYMGFKPQKS